MAAVDGRLKSSVTVLSVVVACFAILWPKIFYPMMQSVVFPLQDEEFSDDINFPHMLHPQMRESMGEARPSDKSLKDGFKARVHPSVRKSSKPHSKVAGAMNLVVPIYSIGIILFFAYTVLKIIMKKPSNEVSKLVKMVPQNNIKTNRYLDAENCTRKEILQERKARHALNQYGKDKVLTALKTIILEMEEFKENFIELDDLKPKINVPVVYSTNA